MMFDQEKARRYLDELVGTGSEKEASKFTSLDTIITQKSHNLRR